MFSIFYFTFKLLQRVCHIQIYCLSYHIQYMMYMIYCIRYHINWKILAAHQSRRGTERLLNRLIMHEIKLIKGTSFENFLGLYTLKVHLKYSVKYGILYTTYNMPHITVYDRILSTLVYLTYTNLISPIFYFQRLRI